MPKNVPFPPRYRLEYVLSKYLFSCDNSAMEKMIEWLRMIGWTDDKLAYVAAHYDELREYLLYLRAVYDDRHEYV